MRSVGESENEGCLKVDVDAERMKEWRFLLFVVIFTSAFLSFEMLKNVTAQKIFPHIRVDFDPEEGHKGMRRGNVIIPQE